MTIVPPHLRRPRKGLAPRPISGYRRQRRSVLALLAARSGHPDIVCDVNGCHAPEEDLQVVHLKEDKFSNYASRSGGPNYSRWMVHVRKHPENYGVMCAEHHGKLDCRIVPPPSVHRTT
jgi:hypothetical protein